MARWTNVKTSSKPSNSKRDYLKSLAKVTQDSILVSELGTMKELKESIPKLDGDGTSAASPSSLRRGGFFFDPSVEVFRIQAVAIPL